MDSEEAGRLVALGFGGSFAADFAALGRADVLPGRVVRQDRQALITATGRGELLAHVPGSLTRGRRAVELPTIGDWLALTALPGEERATVVALLPRRTSLVRHVAGTETTEQVLAANIDILFLVSGLDRDFNPRRIERYLILAWQSGAQPVIVLNKTDICDNLEACVAAAEQLALGVQVVAVSALQGRSLEVLQAFLGRGRTGAFVGSSGVGKSSLVNALLGERRLATGRVRPHDQRGRHTTARRELVLLPDDSGCVIDTPGLRELQLWGDDDALRQAFADIDALAAQCHFRDCTHDLEPGCAVRLAIEEDRLSTDRFNSYRALKEELASLQGRAREHRSRSETRRGVLARRRGYRQHGKDRP